MQLESLQPGSLYKLVPTWWNSAGTGGWAYTKNPYQARLGETCPFGTVVLCLSARRDESSCKFLYKFLLKDEIVWFDAYVVEDGMIEVV